MFTDTYYLDETLSSLKTQIGARPDQCISNCTANDCAASSRITKYAMNFFLVSRHTILFTIYSCFI